MESKLIKTYLLLRKQDDKVQKIYKNFLTSMEKSGLVKKIKVKHSK